MTLSWRHGYWEPTSQFAKARHLLAITLALRIFLAASIKLLVQSRSGEAANIPLGDIGGIIGGIAGATLGGALHSGASSGLPPGVHPELIAAEAGGNAAKNLLGHTGPPTIYQKRQMESTIEALKNEDKVTEMQKEASKLMNTYNEAKKDIRVPLSNHVDALENERNLLVKKASFLAKKLRLLYDSANPEMQKVPLVVVVKDDEDDFKAKVNAVDSEGAMDAMRGIMTPCSKFHEKRSAQEKEINDDEKNGEFAEEMRSLQNMDIAERIAYDAEMIRQYEAKATTIRNELREMDLAAKRRPL